MATQSGDEYVIARAGERLRLDGAGMTRLVFGGPDSAATPLGAAIGALREIVAELFPLPSFSPGLNCR